VLEGLRQPGAGRPACRPSAVKEAAKASEFRVRLELSERAESTLREELAEERRRREEAEREREDLRQELATVRESRESPQAVQEQPEKAVPQSDGRDSGERTAPRVVAEVVR
jgi:hypothetical protein